MRRKEKSKFTYKLLLITLKYIPVLLSLLYIISSVASYIGVEVPVIYSLSKMSLICWIFMHLSSIVFKFCMYHRMFLYYLFIVNVANFLKDCLKIESINFNLIVSCLTLSGIILFLILFKYVRNNKKVIARNN